MRNREPDVEGASARGAAPQGAPRDRIARARLADVEQRIRSLTALKSELELMIKGCRQGYVANCRVIEVLADHGQCAHNKH
jgi:hypothetical protein